MKDSATNCFEFLYKHNSAGSQQFISFVEAAITAYTLLEIDAPSAPRTSLINCRTALEFSIKWIYSEGELSSVDYEGGDLYELLNTPEFQKIFKPNSWEPRLEHIRRLGNRAVHNPEIRIEYQEAEDALKYLHSFLTVVSRRSDPLLIITPFEKPKKIIEPPQKGDPDSLYKQALKHLHGIDVPKNIDKAIEIFKQLIENYNHENALNTLAILVEQGEKKALNTLFEISIWHDYDSIINILYKLSDRGYLIDFELLCTYIQNNNKKSLDIIKKLAKYGNIEAQYQAAIIYEKGYIVRKNIGIAARYYYNAAKQYHNLAFENLRNLAEKGNKTAKELLHELEPSPALPPEPSSQPTPDPNPELDPKILREQAEQLDKESKEKLEDMAEQGIADAQYQLAIMYSNGKAVELNYEQAVSYHHAAAKQGHSNATDALLWIAKNKTTKNALNALEQLAIAGNAKTAYRLGDMYEKGRGVPVDAQQASRWYCLAVKLGYLGALKALEKMAERGTQWAQYALGWIYQHGYGVSRDSEQAELWFRMAAEQGEMHVSAVFDQLNIKQALSISNFNPLSDS